MKQPHVSVVICTLDRNESLFQTLDSIFDQTVAPETIQILVVDNGGSDQLKAAVAEMKHGAAAVQYVREIKPGISNARNTGIQSAAGRIIAFIDDDALADRHWLENLLKTFSQPPHPDAVTGPILPPNGFRLPEWFPDRLWSHLGLFCSEKKPQKMKYPHFGFGANMAIRRNIFEKVGNFDPRLGRVGTDSYFTGEETDLFLRIQRSGGLIVYSPEALVVHKVPARRLSIEWLLSQTFWIGFASGLIERKSLSRCRALFNGTMALPAILTGTLTGIGSIFIGNRAFKILLRCFILNRMGYLMGFRSPYRRADACLRRFSPLVCRGLPDGIKFDCK